MVVWMLKKDHFASSERLEVAQNMSSMLGFTEYGLLDEVHWEAGYYDRIEDKYCQYQRQDFPQAQKST